jgi:hypothetical protein
MTNQERRLLLKGRYEGPNKYIKCPDCGLKMEIYPEAFYDGAMDHLTCGATGDVNRQRGDSRGCGALFGIRMTLEAHVQVYKMKEVD